MFPKHAKYHTCHKIDTETDGVHSKICTTTLQGGPSGCSPDVVDIKTKIVIYYKKLILERNLCSDVNQA